MMIHKWQALKQTNEKTPKKPQNESITNTLLHKITVIYIYNSNYHITHRNQLHF